MAATASQRREGARRKLARPAGDSTAPFCDFSPNGSLVATCGAGAGAGSVKRGRPGSKEARLAMQKGKKGQSPKPAGRQRMAKRSAKTSGQKRRGPNRAK